RLGVTSEPDDPPRVAFVLTRDERGRRRRRAPLARERLTHHVVTMRIERRADALVAFDEQLDPIRDLEAGLLACVLHGAHELAREAFAPELVVERRVEADEIAALLRAGETLGRSALDEQIGGLDLELLAVDRERLRLAARHGGRDRGAVGAREVLANRR